MPCSSEATAGTCWRPTDATPSRRRRSAPAWTSCWLDSARLRSSSTLAGQGVRRGAYEAHHVTVEEHASLTSLGVDLVPLGWQVEDLRRVKDEDELALLREACAIGDRALTDLLPWLKAGRTERQVARRLEELMLDQGGDGAGFDTIVAGGSHSSIPHHQPTDRPLEDGDFLKLDFGSLYRGYHADMTRMLVVGRSPSGLAARSVRPGGSGPGRRARGGGRRC